MTVVFVGSGVIRRCGPPESPGSDGQHPYPTLHAGPGEVCWAADKNHGGEPAHWREAQDHYLSLLHSPAQSWSDLNKSCHTTASHELYYLTSPSVCMVTECETCAVCCIACSIVLDWYVIKNLLLCSHFSTDRSLWESFQCVVLRAG